ncbi:hypothetical protein [Halalkalibacter okhensis]|uniref:Permease n=1 Tax=Halalkalibacter okhensis TaxID=333138 RepID=A0A0B0I817_9BACI|nr:hypothetical protein [Halalkalibacter okhensis]KHF38643.1 hypothetical protein LQ50_19810 [Halalkalibacter okhensis]
MKYPKIFNLLMIILPWLTVPFLVKHDFKKFLPGTIFMSIYLLFEASIAEKRRWWTFYAKIHPKVWGIIPLIIGPFFIGSIWILKFTYGKFFRYLVLNLVVDGFFTYLLIPWLTKIKYVSLVRLKRYQLSLLFLLKSVLMYGFQYYFENKVSD